MLCVLLIAASQIYAQLPSPCGAGTVTAEDCVSTCISCNFNGYTGTTAGFAASPVPSFCSDIQNDQWIGFIANATNATFTVTPSGCANGVQVALYGGCGEAYIACNAGSAGGGNVPRDINANLIPGTNYYLLVDGYGGDQCNISIDVFPANAVSAAPVGPVGPVSGPIKACPGTTLTYSIADVSGAGTYTWTAPPGATINGQPSPLVFDAPNGKTVSVTFGTQGGQVCVKADNTCFAGGSQCRDVVVAPIPPTVLEKSIVCNEDVPFLLPWGTPVFASGTYPHTYMSYQGCDSVVQKEVVVKPAITTQLPPQSVCVGGSVSVCGVQYSQTTNISQLCTSYQGCDSIVNMQFTVLDPVATITYGSIFLTCTNSTVTLGSLPSPAGSVKTWTLNGLPLGSNTDMVNVTAPGAVVLTTTLEKDGVTCTETDMIIVDGNLIPPSAQAYTIGTLGCAGGGSATVNVLTDAFTANYTWAGPGGFSSLAPNPGVVVAGTYTVTVQNVANGCTATSSIEVTGNATPPTASASAARGLTCIALNTSLTATTNANPATFAWSGPGGYSGTGATPATLATLPGTYTVTVTATSSGCTTTATVAVVQNNTLPGVMASVVGTLSCTVPSVTLNASTAAATPTFSWSGPGFTSTLQNPSVGAAGTYTVTVTSGTNGCTSSTSLMVAANNALPNISTTGASISCGTQSATLTGNSTTPNVTYSWTGPGGFTSSLPNPSVNMVGNYVLTVSAPNGCMATSTAVVAGDFAPPNISVSGGTISCVASATTIMGNSTTTGATFQWTGPSGFMSSQQNPSVTALGNYILTVTAPNGCTSSATATVNGNNTLPVVTTTGGTITCTTLNIPLSATSSASNSTYSWSGPGGYSATGAMPATPATVNGTYTVTVTDVASTCSATATATVGLNNTAPGATASVTGNGMLSCPTPTVTLNATTAASNPAFSWSGPGFTSTLQNPVVSGAGTYIVTVTAGGNGCTSTASVVVAGDNSLPNATATGTALNCTTQSATITGNSTTTGVTFGWTGPNGFVSNQQNPTVSVPGPYVFTVTAANGCTATSTATVTGDFTVPAGVSAVGGQISCSASAITLMGNSTTPNVTYSWTGPGGFTSMQQNPSVSTVGSYILTATSQNGCTATATTTVTPDVNLPNATASGGTFNCNVTSLALNGASTTPGVTPAWTGPNGFISSQFNPTVTVPGVYNLTVTNAANGCSAQASATILLDTVAPGATATAGTLTCANPNFTLSGSATATNVTWAWAGPSGFTSMQQNPTATNAGTYTLTVTNQGNGCTSTSSAELLADQNAPTASATTGTLTCTDTAIILNGNSTLPGTYQWNGPNGFNSSNQNVSVSTAGDYTLVVTSANGCTDAETVTVAEDIALPGATAQGDTITCAAPTVTISVISSAVGAIYQWTGPDGFSSILSSDTVNTGGTYIVQVTGQNGCISTATAFVEASTELPLVQLSAPDTLTCIITSVDIQASVMNPASSIQTLVWTGPNGFTVSNVEDPSVTAPGTYTLVATSANGCSGTQNVIVSQNVALPDVTAQGGTLTCKTIALNLDGASTTVNVEYNWTGPGGFTSGQSDPSVNADGPYILTVTGSNGCTASATTTVALDTIAPGATAASANDLDCDDLSTTLQAGSPTTSVVYEWSGPNGFTSTDQNTPTTAPGTYGVVVTSDANGCTSAASVLVSQDILPPTATATGDTIDCTSGIASLLGNSTTTNVTYAWSGPGGFTSNLQNTTATVIGDYPVTVTASNGCTAVAVAVVASNNNVPDVSLSAPDTLTCTNDTLTITGTINTPASGFNAVWSGPGGFTSTQPSIQITVPGSYVYTVVNTANGCKAQPAVTIAQDIQKPQAVTATGGLLNCTSPSISLTATTTTTGVTYLWSGPGGFTSTEQNPVVSNPGTYTVVVTATGNGCTDFATAEVTQDPTVPTIAVTTDTLTCSLQSVVLNAETTTPNVTFLWEGPGITNNSTQEDPTVSLPGLYTITVTAVSGCTSTFDIIVSQNIAPPVVTTQGDTLSCSLPTGVISVSSAPGVTYAWSGPNGFVSTLSNPTVNEPGLYMVTATATNGCTTVTSTIVAADASIPQLTTTGGTISCKVDSVQLTVTSSVPATWLWSGPGGFTSTQQNPTVVTAGNYSVVATAANGCSTSKGAVVEANTNGPNVSLATPGQLDCTTTRIDLNATVQTAGNYTFTWTTATGNIVSGANTPKPQVSTAGTYVVSVLNNFNGCVTRDSVTVNVDPAVPSSATRQVRDVSCFGDTNGSIVIDSIVGGTGPFVYSIDNLPFGSTTSFNSLPPGVHSIVIQDAKGCELEFSITIMEPEELIVQLGPDTTIHLGQQIIISADNIVSDTSRIERLTFTPADLFTANSSGLDTLQPTYSFRYEATVVDANGCKASDARTIIVDKTRYVFIPNIFDPTSADNSLFMIAGGEDVLRIKSFQVYDRWGQVVHEYFDFLPNDVNSAWDGKIDGKKANPAVFVYYAEIEFVDGETELYRGDVMLMH